MEKKNSKFNGYAKWIIAVIATATLVYNSIATHVIARNEIKHLQESVKKLEVRVEKIYQYMIEDR